MFLQNDLEQALTDGLKENTSGNELTTKLEVR